MTAHQLEQTPIQNQIILKLKPTHKLNISTNKKSLGLPTIDKIAAKRGDYTIKQFGYSQPQTPKKNRPNFENIVILHYNNDINIKQAIKDFEASGMIEYAEPNAYCHGVGKFEAAPSGLMITPNDSMYNRQYWSENDGTFDLSIEGRDTPPCVADADIDLEAAWEYTTGDAGIKIAFVDSGFKMDHPEMAGRLIAGRDFVDDDDDPTDENGHGTNVVGIAAAIGNNGIGHAGVNWTSPILIVRVLNEYNSGSWAVLAEGIVYAVDNGADIINLSVGGQNPPAVLREAIEYAYANEIFMAVAMGNANTGIANYPAAYPEVIAIGATDCDDTRVDGAYSTWGSSYGSHIDIVAPGNWILGLRHDTNEYGRWIGGTSMATPMVAGAASLLLSINPDLSVEQLRDILRNTAEDQVGNPAEDTPGFDIYHGAGRLNVAAAIASILNCDGGVEGSPCNDDDACTVNDVLDADCNCVGTFADNDNDGICDANDNTNGNCTLSSTCDDGDDCTTGDTFDADCNCIGILLDGNNNNICDLDESDAAYHLTFNVAEVDCQNQKLSVDFAVQATNTDSEFNIADQNYRMSFSSALANPTIVQELDVSGITFLPNDEVALYSSHSILGSSDTIISYNIELQTVHGLSIGTTPVPVGRIGFDVVDDTGCFDIKWHTSSDYPPTVIIEETDGVIRTITNESYTDITICMDDICPPCLDIELYAQLEGAYDSNTNQMTNHLYSRGLLPGQIPVSSVAVTTPAGQPYHTSPWNYTGTEGADWTDANYTGNETDWVLVSVRTGMEKSTEVGMLAGVLKQDGKIEFPIGSCGLPNTFGDSVYVLVEHRNHVGIMTAQPVSIVNNRLVHDFRIADSYHDATSVGQKQLPSGTWCMFVGDAYQMDFPSYDINGSDKVEWLDVNGFFNHYISPDFNLDGDVNGEDKGLWIVNNGISSRVPK